MDASETVDASETNGSGRHDVDGVEAVNNIRATKRMELVVALDCTRLVVPTHVRTYVLSQATHYHGRMLLRWASGR